MCCVVVLWCVALCRIVSRYVPSCCVVLRYSVLHYVVVWYVTSWGSVCVLCCVMLCRGIT